MNEIEARKRLSGQTKSAYLARMATPPVKPPRQRKSLKKRLKTPLKKSPQLQKQPLVMLTAQEQRFAAWQDMHAAAWEELRKRLPWYVKNIILSFPHRPPPPDPPPCTLVPQGSGVLTHAGIQYSTWQSNHRAAAKELMDILSDDLVQTFKAFLREKTHNHIVRWATL